MSGSVALVTGSSRGIGLATAKALAEAGFSIALNSPEHNEELEQAVASVSAIGVPVFGAVFDVTDTRRLSNLLDDIETALGPLTTLVNNAGVGALQRGDVLDVTEESFDRCMQVNARALFFLCQEFARRTITRERDDRSHYSIVNVTSSNAEAAAETRAEYCASKAAAAMVSRNFAVRLGRENVSVYDVRPGIIETELTRPVMDQYQMRIQDGLCLEPRVGRPEDVAHTIVSLATGKLPYATGQVVNVDGGLLVPRF